MAALSTDLLAPLLVFRVLFGLTCTFKFAVETRRGYAAYFDRGRYLHERYTRAFPRTRLTPGLYRVLYAGKLVAAPALALGICARPALVIVALALAFELRIHFKYHANLLFLLAVILLAAPGLDHHLTLPGLVARGDVATWIADATTARGDQLARWAIVATISVMYVAAALRKRTPAFLQGAVVHRYLRYMHEERSRRHHSDYWLPRGFFERFVFADPAALRRRWAPLMGLVFVLELVLPALLWIDATRPLAIGLGLAMHAGFTLMFPAALLPFALVTTSAYALFADPSTIAALLARLG
jgi:hypothetical protein